MISTPTVLILGAGASYPYGYPLGEQLVDQILQSLSKKQSKMSQLLRSYAFDQNAINKFRESLFYSGKVSIDAFLEHRPEFIEIGKLAIAYALMRYEDPANLFKSGNWYRYFYNLLNTSRDEFTEQKISIITFNYDRSLEFYFYNALFHSYGLNEDECVKMLNEIPIVHVYGQLGKLPWQGENGIEYRQDHTPGEVKTASEGIRIIHEQFDIHKDPEFSRAHEILRGARRIFFIGFGYHKENIDRLLIPPHKELRGTIYDLELAEINKVKRLFDPETHKFKPSSIDTDALLFFRRDVYLS